jgi:sulfide:quinone oxidoreductase
MTEPNNNSEAPPSGAADNPTEAPPSGAADRPSKSGEVVIIGGGVAALEALLALHHLARDRVALTLVSGDEEFVDRPVTVAEPFHLRSAAHHSLPEIADELGAKFVHAKVAGVDGSGRRVTCTDGTEISFDTLILAPGARQRPPFAQAIAFGLEGSGQAVREMLERLRSGEARSAEFVAPSTTGWVLPLYELALMTALDLARSGIDGVKLSVLSPEDRPLLLFGDHASKSVARLLAAAGIDFVGSSTEPRGADYVVTLPLLSGPELAGVPGAQPHNFIPVDEYGRVTGLDNVYAAGDAVDFPVKQGGLAAQQADAVAEHVAASYGASVEPTPFRPVLRGMLFTGEEPLFMRSGVQGSDPDVPDAWHPLWWPPTKIAGRYLAPFLSGRGEVEAYGSHPIGFVDIDMPLTAATLPG